MKQRIGWVDIVKGISMICVMLSHSGMGIIGPHIGSFFIPIFFFISGYTCSVQKYSSIKEIIKNKARNLFQPYFLFYGLLLLFYLSLRRIIFTFEMLVFERISGIGIFMLHIEKTLLYVLIQITIAIICLLPVI